jgi:hypothetical protein
MKKQTHEIECQLENNVYLLYTLIRPLLKVHYLNYMHPLIVRNKNNVV